MKKNQMAFLRINNEKYNVETLKSLTQKLKSINNHKFVEVWLELHNGKSMVALINSDLAFLNIFEDEETFYHSYNSENEPEMTEIKFKLSNGQIDFYPKKNCVKTEIAIKAIKSFFKNKAKPQFINWL